ncbi:MAG: type II toxin-antitoxin system VapC family toxin [Proteobacteria bacterium]|nr:type II toxin-antitoxin system VapC family toxin [Pseudomonadota bacterium]
MVIDTSALVAILLGEPEAEAFAEIIEATALCVISAVTRVELSCVIEGRKGEEGRQAVDRLLVDAQVEMVSVTPRQALLAVNAFRRFGKGRHPAALNIGDCFSYALAMELDRPLLCKGQDFQQTDVPIVALTAP